MAPDNNKVSILYPFIGGPIIGGSHVSALKLIAGLDRDRFSPHILLHRTGGKLGEFIRDHGLEFDLLPDTPILAPKYSRTEGDASIGKYLFRTLPDLRKILRQSQPAVVHTNDGRMHASWALPTKLGGHKLLWHHRDGPRAFGVNNIAPILANRIVGVSNFSKPSRPLRNINTRFTVVRSPFDFPLHPPDREHHHKILCTELGLPENALLFGYFGGLNDRKRPLNFVLAIARLQTAFAGRPVHGLLFGKVILPQSKLDQKARLLASELGIGPQIHLMGYRSPVDSYMAAVDALLVTAVNEPFGRTLIEAMSLGTPVVATRHGGNIEAIEEGRTGFLVPAEDPGAFVPPVQHLMNNADLRRRITQAARDNVLSTFGTGFHVKRMSEIYQEMTAPRPAE